MATKTLDKTQSLVDPKNSEVLTNKIQFNFSMHNCLVEGNRIDPKYLPDSCGFDTPLVCF